jgi:glutathione S-transferase
MSDAFTLSIDPFWISPYALSSFVALGEKGLDFQIKVVDLKKGEHRQAAYAAASLTARVPALLHGDFTLSESSAIAEYLDDLYPDRPRLLPPDVRQRARARQIMAFLRSDLGPLRDERSAETVFYQHPPLPPLSPAGQAAAQKIIQVASALVTAGAKTAFGPAWCIADLDLAMMLMRLVRNDEPVPAPLIAYAEAQWQRPTVRRFVDHPRAPYVSYYA